MNAFLIALLASAVVLVSARSTVDIEQRRLKARLLTPDEQTLKTLLSTPGGSIGGGNSQVPVGQLEYNFNRDYENRIDPHNPSSDWKFLTVNNGQQRYSADNLAIIRDGISSAELVAVPFTKNVAQEQGRIALLSGYEGVLVNKVKFVVEPDHKLTVRAVFAVDVKNVEDNLFGKDSVANATDDPSLATGGIMLASSGKGGLVFSIVATDKGIWAVYERNRMEVVQHPERGDKIFTIFHRLADRKSEEEEIDAAITYVRSQNLVQFKLNNVVVHIVKNLGTLPSNEVGTLAHTLNRPDLVRVEPKEFTVAIGIMSWLDAQDPNNQAHSLSNQKLTTEDVYDEKAKFSDEIANKTLNLWGQGVILKVHDIVIKLEESNGDNNEQQLSGRNGESQTGESDGKLIVAMPTVDSEEIVLITGERAPRINEPAQGDDQDDSTVVEGQDEGDDSVSRQARRSAEPRRRPVPSGKRGPPQ